MPDPEILEMPEGAFAQETPDLNTIAPLPTEAPAVLDTVLPPSGDGNGILQMPEGALDDIQTTTPDPPQQIDWNSTEAFDTAEVKQQLRLVSGVGTQTDKDEAAIRMGEQLGVDWRTVRDSFDFFAQENFDTVDPTTVKQRLGQTRRYSVDSLRIINLNSKELTTGPLTEAEEAERTRLRATLPTPEDISKDKWLARLWQKVLGQMPTLGQITRRTALTAAAVSTAATAYSSLVTGVADAPIVPAEAVATFFAALAPSAAAHSAWVEAGSTMEELRDVRGTDGEPLSLNLQRAVLIPLAGLSGAVEAVSFGAVGRTLLPGLFGGAKKTVTAGVKRALQDGSYRRMIGEIIKNLGITAATEGAEELAQTAIMETGQLLLSIYEGNPEVSRAAAIEAIKQADLEEGIEPREPSQTQIENYMALHGGQTITDRLKTDLVERYLETILEGALLGGVLGFAPAVGGAIWRQPAGKARLRRAIDQAIRNEPDVVELLRSGNLDSLVDSVNESVSFYGRIPARRIIPIARNTLAPTVAKIQEERFIRDKIDNLEMFETERERLHARYVEELARDPFSEETKSLDVEVRAMDAMIFETVEQAASYSFITKRESTLEGLPYELNQMGALRSRIDNLEAVKRELHTHGASRIEIEENQAQIEDLLEEYETIAQQYSSTLPSDLGRFERLIDERYGVSLSEEEFIALDQDYQQHVISAEREGVAPMEEWEFKANRAQGTIDQRVTKFQERTMVELDDFDAAIEQVAEVMETVSEGPQKAELANQLDMFRHYVDMARANANGMVTYGTVIERIRGEIDLLKDELVTLEDEFAATRQARNIKESQTLQANISSMERQIEILERTIRNNDYILSKVKAENDRAARNIEVWESRLERIRVKQEQLSDPLLAKMVSGEIPAAAFVEEFDAEAPAPFQLSDLLDAEKDRFGATIFEAVRDAQKETQRLREKVIEEGPAAIGQTTARANKVEGRIQQNINQMSRAYKKDGRAEAIRLVERIFRPIPRFLAGTPEAISIQHVQESIDPNFRRETVLGIKKDRSLSPTEFYEKMSHEELSDARMQALDQIADKIKNNAAAVPLRQLLQTLQQPLNEYTLGDLNEIYTQTELLRLMARDRVQYRRFTMEQDVAAAERSLDRALMQKRRFRHNKDIRASKAAIKGARSSFLTPSEIMDELDGGQDFRGIIHDILIRRRNEQHGVELERFDERQTALRKKMDDLGVQVSDLRKKGMIDDPLLREMTVDKLLGIYVASKNVQLSRHLASGMGILIAHQKMVQEWMAARPELTELADYMSADFRKRFVDQMEVTAVLTQSAPDALTLDMPVISRVAGLHPDFQKAVDSQLQFGDPTWAEMNINMFKNITGQDFVSGNVKEIRLDLLGMWNDYARRQEHYIAFADLASTWKMIENRLGGKIKDNFGAGFLKNVSSYMRDNINPTAMMGSWWWDKMATWLMRNSAIKYLAASVPTVIKQLPSSMLYMSESNPAYYAASLAKFAGAIMQGKNPIKMIQEIDPLFKYRQAEHDLMNFKRAITDNPFIVAKDKVFASLMGGIQLADRVAVAIGWDAVYQYAKVAEQMSDADAIAKAQQVTQRTQPSADRGMLPSAYRSNSLMRYLLMFTQQSTKIFNMATRGTAQKFKQKKGVQLASMWSVIGLNTMLFWALENGKLPENQEDWQDFAFSFTRYIPLVGKRMLSQYRGDVWGGGGTPFGMMVDQGADVGRAIDSKESDRIIKETIDAATTVLRLPYTSPKRLIDAFDSCDFRQFLFGSTPEVEDDGPVIY